MGLLEVGDMVAYWQSNGIPDPSTPRIGVVLALGLPLGDGTQVVHLNVNAHPVLDRVTGWEPVVPRREVPVASDYRRGHGAQWCMGLEEYRAALKRETKSEPYTPKGDGKSARKVEKVNA